MITPLTFGKKNIYRKIKIINKVLYKTNDKLYWIIVDLVSCKIKPAIPLDEKLTYTSMNLLQYANNKQENLIY